MKWLPLLLIILACTTCSSSERQVAQTPIFQVPIDIRKPDYSKDAMATQYGVYVQKGGHVVYKLPPNTIYLTGSVDDCYVGLYDTQWRWNTPVEYAGWLALVYWDKGGTVRRIEANCVYKEP